MKANEAPEKIFLFENPIDGTPDHRWLSKKSSDEDIEYTRTDAFLTKARKWFEHQNEWINIDGTHQCDMDSFEDFKNYMEVE